MTLLHNKADFYVRHHSVDTAGTPEHLGGYMTGVTTISFTSNGAGVADTIADSASNFLKKGFKAGDSITITGASNSGNNDTFTIASITAGTITLNTDVVLTTEAAGASVTITAAARTVNQEVPDGASVVVRAHPDNTGYIYVGNSSTNALSTSNNMMPLYRDSLFKVQITHLRNLWVDVATSGDKVVVYYEQ